MANENNLPTPVTSEEKFAAKAAGMSVDVPTPVTNMEKYLNAISGSYGNSYTKAETDTLLAGKADVVDGKVPASQLPSATEESAGIMSAEDKLKLDGITTDTSVVIIEDALNVNSTNALENGVIARKFVDVDANIAALRLLMNATLYGYRINKNDSNPETRVEYLYDAVGMTPALMNFTTGQFDYGSWANAWFITENKPCAVNYNGTVDYYLDPTDYTKKADGTASDLFVLLTEEPSDWETKYTEYFTKDENDDFVFVTGESAPAFAADTYYTNSTYAGNFMAQMPTVWFKRWEDADYEYVAICNKKLNSDFMAYAHDAGDGYINPYIYLPMFKGVTVGGKLRSIVGAKVEGSTTGSQEKSRAEANGTGWQLWDWAKHELISDLLTLISRSTNSQGAFGQGDTNTYVNNASQNYGKLNTGQHKVDGVWKLYENSQFYGKSNSNQHVRAFHIEDFWGNRWDRCLGLNLVNLEYKYKMVRPYALDSDSSYVSTGLTAPQEGWQKTQYSGEFGILPKTVGGSQTTYVCDYFWSLSGTRLALFGGYCDFGTRCGSRYLNLYNAASFTSWSIGGSPCFNPPHEGV